MRELFDDLKEFITALEAEENLIIVEGKKDVNALRKLGVESIEIKNGLKEFCEKISSDNKEIILLMDTDKKGVELTKKLKQYFAKLGVKVNVFYWYCLKKLRVMHVESLAKKLGH